MDDWADNEARKMPPLVIIYPTEPHVLDFDSAFPG